MINMKIIKVDGSYDSDKCVYIAQFSCGSVTSVVTGSTPNVKHLRENLGVIRAIEHALSFYGFDGNLRRSIDNSDFEIHHNCKFVNDMFSSEFKSAYPEVSKARAYLKPYKSKIKYKK